MTFLNLDTRLRLCSHRHEYESEFPFTGCLSLVQASPARVERSRSLVQAYNSIACLLTIFSEIESSECFAEKSNNILLHR